MKTIIQKINDYSNNIFIKREDLLPFSFGGNKVRIAQEYFDDMEQKGGNCIIGYGNARSNLCRVIANLSYMKGNACHIISPADDNGDRLNTNNSFIINACKAVLHACNKTDVAETVEKVLADCKEQGYKPYYIYGDKYGKGNDAVPVRAYAKIYYEIFKQAKSFGIRFDYIFLSTGTGMTQAGLIAGQSIYGGVEKRIGISVARTAKQEINVINNYLDAYCKEVEIKKPSRKNIYLQDQYLCGGYGKYDKNISNTINKAMKEIGIPLDPTYTGKGYYGMTRYLKENNIRNKNILFIHTGGVPLFFDNISLLTKEEADKNENYVC